MFERLKKSEVLAAFLLALLLASALTVLGCTNAEQRSSAAMEESQDDISSEDGVSALPANANLVSGVLDSLVFSDQM